jgi:hypothetical protein
MNKCDVCNIEAENVIAGRWIFYCPAHKQNDYDLAYDNEIAPALAAGDGDMDGELEEMLLENS